MKKVQRITESQLNKIVADSVKEVLNEMLSDDVNEGKLSKAAATLALGGALMFGGSKAANAQHTAQHPQQNAIEQSVNQSCCGTYGDLSKVPQKYSNKVCQLAQIFADKYHTDVYVGVGFGNDEDCARSEARFNAEDIYLSVKFGNTYNVSSNKVSLSEVWGSCYNDDACGVISIQFFIMNK